jgi:hypothetical protein
MANDRPIFFDEKYGTNGIEGQKFTNLPGWETGTVGFAGNIYSKLAAQNGIQPVDPEVLAAREPFKTGRFLVKCLKTPPFFNSDACRILRYIFEDTVKDVSGISDYAIDNFTVTNGAIRQNSPYMGIFKENNGEFTLKVPETAGQLVRKILDYWLYGISDPKTGVCHFYGKDLRAVMPNKAASFIYILLGPTCQAADIEYACMWHEAVPTSPKHGHNNSTIGEAGSGVEHDVTFTGIWDRGPEIDILAQKIVTAYNLYGERFTDAALPSYIYDKYFSNGADFNDNDISIDLASRLAADSSVTSDNNSESAYTDTELSTRDSVRASAAGGAIKDSYE